MGRAGSDQLRVFASREVAFSAPPRSFDYPATLQGSTNHFHVYYDPSLGSDGPTLADGVLATCESDYSTLSGYFGGIDAGPFNVIIAPGIPGAYHHGCADGDLYCGVLTSPALDVDFTRLLVVAEVEEVFSAAQGAGWNCGRSNGEGLSRVLAFAMYPLNYPGLSTAASWLDTGRRTNYVTRSAPTDQNPQANGCSVLFLNYLHFQLGYGWDKIVQAGAPTLAAVYQRLTGQGGGWQAFRSLLASHFPPGQPSGLTNDNPFPL